MTIDLTPILQALIALFAALITGYLVPWLKNKVSETKVNNALTYIKIAVQAAEQMFLGAGRGKEKLQYVQSYLETKGFSIDLEMIESTVNELFGYDLIEDEPPTEEVA